MIAKNSTAQNKDGHVIVKHHFKFASMTIQMEEKKKNEKMV